MEKEKGEKVKKPIYKKWWFWVLIAVLVFGGFGGSSSNKDKTEEATTETAQEEVAEEETKEEAPKTVVESGCNDFNVEIVNQSDDGIELRLTGNTDDNCEIFFRKATIGGNEYTVNGEDNDPVQFYLEADSTTNVPMVSLQGKGSDTIIVKYLDGDASSYNDFTLGYDYTVWNDNGNYDFVGYTLTIKQ